MSTESNPRKPVLLRSHLRDIAVERGYDPRSFPSKVMMKLNKRSPGELKTIGILKQTRWYLLDKPAFETWARHEIGYGPKYGLNDMPDRIDVAWIIDQGKGSYSLRAFLMTYRTEFFTYYVMRNNANRFPKAIFKTKGGVWAISLPELKEFLTQYDPEFVRYIQSRQLDHA